MAEAKPFSKVKLICGIIASKAYVFSRGEERLIRLYGPVDYSSPLFEFTITNYYEKQMGKDLKRKFLSFFRVYSPEMLSKIKIRTNRLEEEMKKEFGSDRRIVNLDPGYMTPSSLIMATAKDFAHRIPLENGIYAHLELLFGKNEVRTMSWTYPDYKSTGYQSFFLEVRRIYLKQLSDSRNS